MLSVNIVSQMEKSSTSQKNVIKSKKDKKNILTWILGLAGNVLNNIQSYKPRFKSQFSHAFFSLNEGKKELTNFVT